jgi:molecular chaperone Hsp33
MSDRLLKFAFRGADVRGQFVHLSESWRQMSAHHDYPEPIQRLLGELVAAAALLASSIKFNGALVMQVHGDGPVKLLVVECQPDLSMRATAKLRDEAIAPDAPLQELINRGGRGRFAITLDPIDPLPGQQPYQGIVPLEGDSVSALLETYMRQSEQLETRIHLAADGQACAGLLLQRMPEEGGTSESGDRDAWDRASTLGKTLRSEEMLELSPEDIVHRLFWQEKLDHFTPVSPRFACRCSRERIGRMLISLGREEVDSILTEQGKVNVTCDFCNRQYGFDAVDVEQLFVSGATGEAEAGTQH